MALYSVSLRQAHGTVIPNRKKWTNRFHVDTFSPVVAAELGVELWQTYLRSAATSEVFCYEVYATDDDPLTTNYAIAPVPPEFQRGTIVYGANEPYLTKACVSVTIPIDGFSRPSRKFWRFGLREPDIVAGETLSPTVVNAVISQFNAAIADPALSLKDESGLAYSPVSRIKLTTREFGRTAGLDVPQPPAQG